MAAITSVEWRRTLLLLLPRRVAARWQLLGILGGRSQLAHAAAELASQQRAQRHTVGVTDLRGNLVDTFVAGAQQVQRALDAQVLKVRQRRLAQHTVQAPRQGALARAHGPGGVAEREALHQLLSRPLLEAFDQRVGMGQMVGDDELGLRAARLHQQVARGECGQRRAAAAHHV